MSKQDDINELKELIAQGEEFEKMGYDCGMMNAINKQLLADLESKL
jgi:hypothetical protein